VTSQKPLYCRLRRFVRDPYVPVPRHRLLCQPNHPGLRSAKPNTSGPWQQGRSGLAASASPTPSAPTAPPLAPPRTLLGLAGRGLPS